MNPTLAELAAAVRPFLDRCKAAGQITIAPSLLVGKMTKQRLQRAYEGLTAIGTVPVRRASTGPRRRGVTAMMTDAERTVYWRVKRRHKCSAWRARKKNLTPHAQKTSLCSAPTDKIRP